MKKKIVYCILIIGLLLTLGDMLTSHRLGLLGDVGFVCVMICSVICIKDSIKNIKSQKKDDEETKKW